MEPAMEVSGMPNASSAVKIRLESKDLIKAINDMKKKERDAFLEDLLASTSPEYLDSIREARAEYKAGKIKTHKEVFGS
jgi:hypothetical protein